MESKFNFKNFSIVIPIFNEEEILEESTNAIFSLCKRMEIDFEIIFSENGSTDKTKAIAEELTNKHPEIKIISNPEPNYGNALKTGFKIAKNDLVISFDIDYYSESFLSEALSMKAIKKSEIEKFLPKVVSTQDIFDTELLIRIEKNGGKIKEVPAKVNEIRPSVSLIYKRIPRTLKSLIKLRIIFYKESLKTKNLLITYLIGSIPPFIRIVITRNHNSSFCKSSLMKLITNQIKFGANKLIKLV